TSGQTDMTLPVDNTATATRGSTVCELAQLLRVSPDKIREWIRSGELAAITTSTKGKARYLVLPRDLEKFLAGRAVVPPETKAPPRRKRRQPGLTDYYPGE